MTVIDRIGNEAGRLGDKTGLDFLRYNPIVFKKFDAMSARDAPTVVRSMRAQFPEARRVIDVGAGSCAYAAEAHRQGLEVTAIERSAHGRRWGKRHDVIAKPFDLKAEPPSPIEGSFDLAYCFEVAEHVPEQLANRLVEFLCSLAPAIVFTAAVPGQGGTGHINEQPADYWISRFRDKGYRQQEFVVATEGISQHWAKTNKFAFRTALPATVSGI